MTDDQAFLDILNQNPADDTARLVYADWLDDHSEAEKATYLRRVVDLVRLTPGCGEYSDAAAGLFTVAGQLDWSWRVVAGGRFELIVVKCDPEQVVYAMTLIAELTGWSVIEIAALIYSVPFPLDSWAPFEITFPKLVRFVGVLSRSGDAAMIRPSPWLYQAGAKTTFDVVLARLSDDLILEDGQTNPYVLDFRRSIADTLGVTVEGALDRLRRLPTALATGLPPREVAAAVRDLWARLNIYQVIPPDGIQVIPQQHKS